MDLNQFKCLEEACDKLRSYMCFTKDFNEEDHVISSIYSILMYFMTLHENDFNDLCHFINISKSFHESKEV